MKNNNPIVLGHAACSGGSLIYRVISKTFGLFGINEIGISAVPQITSFNPWDPEIQLFRRDIWSADEFGELLLDRVRRCQQKLEEDGQRLLLREHTHSFYFNIVEGLSVPKKGSWFIDQYETKWGEKLKGVVSVRNPIDSWLGFRRSFEKQRPVQFDEYCHRYNRYLDSVDEGNRGEKRHLVFHYEEFIADPQKQIDLIAEHIGEPKKPIDLTLVGSTIGSGNSGRSANKLVVNKRRPFTRQFLQETVNSEEYVKLASRLKYPILSSEMDFAQHLRLNLYSVISPMGKLLRGIEPSARKCYELLKSGKNIQ